MKKLALAAALVLVVGLAAFAGPYLSFEQALVPAGLGMPACEATVGITYTLGGFYSEAGEQTQTLSISGDLYVTTTDLWHFPDAVLGHDLTLAWAHVDIDLGLEVDLIGATLSGDLKLTGYITSYLTLWGRVAGFYGPVWSLEPYIGIDFAW